ncbi:BgTH12-04826 [Blumeria graminis f. sp. triticale]|uniref:BgtA-21008 n=3 Tax=Blumeria graminis TaxID=34373 RepID=A0A9X9L8N3_BLUGR|nr:BgTH12-04826 [Blumeria graminis f. sp. triticale]VCU39289.1 BgtA-21008 [Blumeria graminis f. sp. tritici]
MSCLLATLLYTGMNSGANNRLVLAYDDLFDSIQMTYTLNPNQKFPEPNENIPIFKTPTTYHQAGTYFAIYCSVDKTSSDIYHDIVLQLSEETGELRSPSSKNNEREEICFQHITRKMDEKKSSFFQKSGISTRYLDKNICPEKLIVQLAYNWRIYLIMGNKSPLRGTASSKPQIRLESPIEIENYVENGELITEGNMNSERYSLAWFEDHLHMFAWNSKEKMWGLYTTPYNVRNNGRIIINFLRATNPQISNIMKNAYATLEEYRQESRNKVARKQHEQKKTISYYNERCRNHMSEIEMSTAISAKGRLWQMF